MQGIKETLKSDKIAITTLWLSSRDSFLLLCNSLNATERGNAPHLAYPKGRTAAREHAGDPNTDITCDWESCCPQVRPPKHACGKVPMHGRCMLHGTRQKRLLCWHRQIIKVSTSSGKSFPIVCSELTHLRAHQWIGRSTFFINNKQKNVRF